MRQTDTHPGKEEVMKKILAFGFMCVVLLTGQMANAQSGNLKGISGISFGISVDKVLTDAGVDKDVISTNLELKMRSVGLTVFDSEHKATPEEVTVIPKLKFVAVFVTIYGLKIKDTSVYCYSYSIEVSEEAAMKHAPNTYAFVTTWSTTNIGYFGSDRAEAVKTVVADAADKFCNDYLSANPKPSLVPALP